MPFWRFALALAIVAIPAAVLEERGEDEWAWRYAGLILLVLVVANWSGLSRLANWAGRTVRGG